MEATATGQHTLMGEVAVTRKRLAEAILAMPKLREELGLDRNGLGERKTTGKPRLKLLTVLDCALSHLCLRASAMRAVAGRSEASHYDLGQTLELLG